MACLDGAMHRCADFDGRIDPRAQAAANCTLVGFDRSRWCGTADSLITIHMGASPKRGAKYPREDIEHEGCPAGWATCGFVSSVMRYVRRRTAEGQRVPNPLLDMSNDWLLAEAVNEFEAAEDRRHEQVNLELM